MHSLRLMIVLSILKISGAAVKAVVSITPNWTKILQGDAVTLTCILPSTAPEQEYFWFRPNQQTLIESKTLWIQYARTEDSGEYRCQGRYTVISDPVRLNIVNSVIILQVPPSVYEGDTVFLRCHSRYPAGKPTFYKNSNTVIQYTDSNSLEVKDITMSAAGRYYCTKVISHSIYQSPEEILSIKELFLTPKISVWPQATTEGTDVALTCTTTVSPPKQGTELQFAFYKDSEKVQEFGIFNTYQVWAARPEDSGSYNCEVKASTNVYKRSDSVGVTIQELFTFPQIKANSELMIEGAEMILTCDAISRQATELLFSFYRDEQIVKGFGSSNKYYVHSATSEDSGLYACEAKTLLYNIKKTSIAVTIQVQELFSDPEIKVSTQTISEGTNMNLTCNTTLRQSTGDTKIQFAFYKNGKIVQDFSLADKYHVPEARMEDTGNYSCEVRTSTVRKISNVASIQVQANYTGSNYLLPGVIGVLAVLLFVVIILTIVIRRKVMNSRDKHKEAQEENGNFNDLRFPEAHVRPKNKKPPKPGPAHTMDKTVPPQEDELCYAHIKINSKNTVAPAPPAENDVIYTAVKTQRMNTVSDHDQHKSPSHEGIYGNVNFE